MDYKVFLNTGMINFCSLILNYIFFPIIGDEFDDEEMLDWLTDPNIMEVSDQIEKVNRKMFEKLTKRNDHMAVFFCKFNI